MSISYQVLGVPGRDNALVVHIDSGHSVERLLFDCGDHCLSALEFSEVQTIDQLFFSHLHMDHIGGFDSFFRCNFDRKTKRNQIWGPPGTANIMQHRFQGFLWNLNDQMAGTWHVTDVYPDKLEHSRYELLEGFAKQHAEGPTTYDDQVIWGNEHYTVSAYTMNHRTPTLAYIVRENPRHNIDTKRLEQLGLPPGPWLKNLKDGTNLDATIHIAGQNYSIADLRDQLMVETPGQSIAYLTDFLLDDQAMARLAEPLSGCDTVICEGQYRHSDIELAWKNYHMTTVLSATLAKKAQVGKLILFHLSDRYDQEQWLEMLQEARAIFPNTHYPPHWQMD